MHATAWTPRPSAAWPNAVVSEFADPIYATFLGYSNAIGLHAVTTFNVLGFTIVCYVHAFGLHAFNVLGFTIVHAFGLHTFYVTARTIVCYVHNVLGFTIVCYIHAFGLHTFYVNVRAIVRYIHNAFNVFGFTIVCCIHVFGCANDLHTVTFNAAIAQDSPRSWYIPTSSSLYLNIAAQDAKDRNAA